MALLLLLAGLALGGPAEAGGDHAGGDRAGTRVPAKATLVDLPSVDLYSIHGMFEASSPPESVWRVLCDYVGLAGIVNGLVSSRVLERKGNEVLVEQVFQARFLFFSKDVRLRLRIKEYPPLRIEFAGVAGGPFRVYQGAWRIIPTKVGCRVDYTLAVSRGDMAPRFLERRLLRANASALIRDLSSEVGRRAAKALAQSGAHPLLLQGKPWETTH